MAKKETIQRRDLPVVVRKETKNRIVINIPARTIEIESHTEPLANVVKTMDYFVGHIWSGEAVKKTKPNDLGIH